MQPFEVAVLFYSNLSRRPFLRQVVDLDLLLCPGFDSEYAAFFPVSCVYSETNDWSKDWLKRWALLWSAPTSLQFHGNFHFTWKKKVTRCGPKFSWLLNWVSIARVVACFLQVSRSRPAATAATQNRPVFVLACPTRASTAGERPQELSQLGRWFCPLNLRLPQASGTTFGEIAAVPDDRQGLKLGLKLELCHLTNEL